MADEQRETIAVIGGGVAGITAAYLLQDRYEVTLFEKDTRLGGHTNTIVIPDGPDEGTAVDTGFIVLNDKTYPLLHRLLARLEVPVRYSDMSFSYYCALSGFHYAGTDLSGLFADRMNLARPSFYSFLWELTRFCQQSLELLARDAVPPELTLERYLHDHRYSAALIERYVLPMGGAIWSAPRDEMLAFPALTFLHFFKNHGLLSLRDRPRWQTVVGGSCSYVERFKQRFNGRLQCGHPVRSVRRQNAGVALVTDAGSERFDRVVIAAHGDQARMLLEDPTALEQELLGAWSYQKNHVVLHRDITALPPNRRAWASWNYVRERGDDPNAPVPVTYHMNRLQGLMTAADYCVSLNRNGAVRKEHIVYETEYEHPTYTVAAIRAQERMGELNAGSRTYFCGSYFGYGFHEDAVRSAAAVVKQLGVEW